MKCKFGKSYRLFYFQVRESPAPLNIPTPTPAPDRRAHYQSKRKATGPAEAPEKLFEEVANEHMGARRQPAPGSNYKLRIPPDTRPVKNQKLY